MKDGHNAIFGPDAIISPDSIVLRTDDPIPQTLYIGTDAETQTLRLSFSYDGQYLLDFKSFRVDTLSALIGERNVRGKCNHIFWKSFSINGQVVCMDDCKEAIVIQL